MANLIQYIKRFFSLRTGGYVLLGAAFLFFVPAAEWIPSEMRGASLWAQSEEELYKQANASYEYANKNRSVDNWNAAIRNFEDFIQKYPNSQKRIESELFLGYSYLNRNNYLNAQDGVTGRNHLNYVIQNGNNDKYKDFYRKASLQYAYSYFSLMNYSEAMTALEKFIAEFPNSDDLQYAYYYAGVSASNLRNYQKAQDYFSTCISKFPNGALRAECELEFAGALGSSGQYAKADEQLYRLSMDSGYKYAKKAELERAHLKIEQGDFQGAISLLESFVSRYSNDSANRNLVIEAYKSIGFCYLQLDRYDDGLNAVQKIEQMSQLTPDVAFLKIQLLAGLGRFDEAERLLTQIKNSDFNLNGSDLVNYIQSTIYLAKGEYNQTINTLLGFLNLSEDPGNPGRIVTHYFDDANQNQNTKRLLPRDYFQACGTLVVAYASRYTAVRTYPNDNTLQEAVFQSMYRYAYDHSDAALMKIVEKTDKERQDAFRNPVGWQYASKNQQTNGTSASGYGMNMNSPTLAMNQTSQNNRPVSGAGGNPGGVPVQNNNFQGNNQQTVGNQLIPSSPGMAANNSTANGNPNMNLLPNATQTANVNPLSPANPQQTKKMDEEQASIEFKKAYELYQGNHLNEADEALLNLLMSSETFGKDCPEVAPAAALLRANILFKKGDYNEAQTVCDYLIKMAPQSSEAADASYYLGYRADYYGQRDKAIEYFLKTVNSNHEGNYRPDAYYLLAWNEWERKNTDQAEKYFDKIYRDFQNSQYWSHAAWAEAQIKYKNHDYVKAEKIVNDALASRPDKAIVDRLLLLKGEIALKSQDYVKARIAYQTILREYPESECYQTAKNRLENIEELSQQGGQSDYSEDVQDSENFQNVAGRPSGPSSETKSETRL